MSGPDIIGWSSVVALAALLAGQFGYWRGRTIGTRLERERWQKLAPSWRDLKEPYSTEPSEETREAMAAGFVVHKAAEPPTVFVPTSPCQSKGCPWGAYFAVHWPGQEAKMCHECLERAKGAAAAMGFELAYDALTV